MGVFWESWWLQTRIMDPSLALRPLKRQDWERREKRSKEIQPEKLNWQKWSQAERERKLREIEEMRAKQVIFLWFWEHAITFIFTPTLEVVNILIGINFPGKRLFWLEPTKCSQSLFWLEPFPGKRRCWRLLFAWLYENCRTCRDQLIYLSLSRALNISTINSYTD